MSGSTSPCPVSLTFGSDFGYLVQDDEDQGERGYLYTCTMSSRCNAMLSFKSPIVQCEGMHPVSVPMNPWAGSWLTPLSTCGAQITPDDKRETLSNKEPFLANEPAGVSETAIRWSLIGVCPLIQSRLVSWGRPTFSCAMVLEPKLARVSPSWFGRSF